jgi:hypothetical protein
MPARRPPPTVEPGGPAATQPAADTQPAGSWPRWRSDVLLAVVVLLVTAPVLQPLMAQQASRYALTAAVWDDRTVTIDRYEHLLSVDLAERDGRLYSDKAPGQPVLGVPAYAAYRALGGHPATQTRVFADPGLWAVTLVSAMIPAALLAVAMRRFALRAAPERATHAALGLALGTMLLPFGTVLFGHVLAGLLGLVAYVLLTASDRPDPRRLAGAGAVAGAAVCVEYTAGIIALALAVAAAVAWRQRALWVIAGGVGPALLLGAYHTLAFGGPLRTGYRYSVEFGRYHAEGLVGARLPEPGMLLAVLLGERGLLVLAPLVAVGLADGGRAGGVGPVVGVALGLDSGALGGLGLAGAVLAVGLAPRRLAGVLAAGVRVADGLVAGAGVGRRAGSVTGPVVPRLGGVVGVVVSAGLVVIVVAGDGGLLDRRRTGALVCRRPQQRDGDHQDGRGEDRQRLARERPLVLGLRSVGGEVEEDFGGRFHRSSLG